MLSRFFFMSKNQQPGASDAVRCYSDQEAAELLSCSRRHVVNLRARGELKFATVGKRVVIRHKDLLEFLDANAKGGWAERGGADAA
jgi:excisionase family DNA binding protein